MMYPLLIISALALNHCNNTTLSSQTNTLQEEVKETKKIPLISYKIINIYKHDTTVFTQGFEHVQKNIFLESSGLYNASFIQYYDLKHEKTIKKKKIHPQIFAEGITLMHHKIYLLSWKEHQCLVYNSNLDIINSFNLPSEGWGITHSDSFLIVSSGIDKLHFYEPEYFKQVKSINVYTNDPHHPVYEINELEYINGFIYANIWMKKYILKIDPHNGKVVGKIDLENIIKTYMHSDNEDNVLNGIAWNKETQTLFVTGKQWPLVFELKLLEE